MEESVPGQSVRRPDIWQWCLKTYRSAHDTLGPALSDPAQWPDQNDPPKPERSFWFKRYHLADAFVTTRSTHSGLVVTLPWQPPRQHNKHTLTKAAVRAATCRNRGNSNSVYRISSGTAKWLRMQVRRVRTMGNLRRLMQTKKCLKV